MPVDLDRLARAQALLQDAVTNGAFPGAVALIAVGGQPVAHWAMGHAQLEPEPRPMAPETVFDLASLTKPVAGATAALLLLEDGVWSLDETVASFIPEFAANGKQVVTIRQLLTHSAGFESWAATYTRARDAESALAVVCQLSLAYAPGTEVRYSDVGFSVLGHLVRRVTGAGLDRLLAARVWQPLGMHHTGYRPAISRRGGIAATERGNRFEQAMVQARGETFDGWREYVQVGEVNDGNTWYALGGISSHAGLFASAPDLLKFASMYLDLGAGIVSPASIAEATSVQTSGLPGGWRGLGWELRCPGAGAQFFGDLLSAESFGHTGFTGTSLAIDRQRELVVILLTNRTHPDATNGRIATIRPRFHNLVAASVV